jgi:hypothetical protein
MRLVLRALAFVDEPGQIPCPQFSSRRQRRSDAFLYSMGIIQATLFPGRHGPRAIDDLKVRQPAVPNTVLSNERPEDHHWSAIEANS